MGFSRSHFVAFCQQLLATGVVLSTTLAAAGVIRLEIGPAPDAADLSPAVRTGKAYVETEPVTPTVVTEAVPVVAEATAARPHDRAARPHDRQGRLLAAQSQPRHVGGLLTVGATWNHGVKVAEKAISLQVRSLKNARWSRWESLEYHPDHAPDAAEARTRPGTEPTVVGQVRAVQLRVFTTSGKAPAGLRFALIDPGVGKVESVKVRQPADTAGQGKATSDTLVLASARTGTMPVAAKPNIMTRAQWGADESLRSGNPSYGTIKTAFVHHTVNANTYTREQVPALLRGIYAYHVKGRGWSDIGYNFLVDRFGQIWEGRYGGMDKAVIGAHTLGYNEVGFAMSAIGNFDIVEPPEEIINAYAKLFAWKLSMYNIPADQLGIWVKDRTLNAINGHRDTKATACPGRYLYARIPDIRAKAAAIQRGVKPTPTPTPTPTPPVITPVPEADLPQRLSLVGSQWPDLLLHDSSTGKVWIRPTGGQFGFTQVVAATTKPAAGDLVVAAGDLTGDGAPDLATYLPASRVLKVLAATGERTYRVAGQSTTAVKFGQLIAAGDVNRDGTPDLVGVSGGTLWLLPGVRAGRYAKAVRLSGAWGYPKTVVGDFNGDRTPDVVGLSGAKAIGFALKAGGLGAKIGFSIATAGVDVVLGGGDYTGDGRADLLVRDTSRRIFVRPGVGAWKFGTPLGPFAVPAMASGLSAATVGKQVQVVARAADGTVVSVRTNGRANLLAPIDTGLRIANPAQLLSVGDWNRDGNSDIVTRGVGGDTLMLRLGNGNGRFAAPKALAWRFAKVTRLAAVGDVNGDRFVDLMAQFGTVTKIYLGNGATGVKKIVTAPEKLRTYNQIGRGLWNATGLPRSGFVSSDGTFVAAVAAGGQLGTGYDLVLGLGDVDGDGASDLIARDKATNSVYLLPGTASGELGPRRLIGAGFAQFGRMG